MAAINPLANAQFTISQPASLTGAAKTETAVQTEKPSGDRITLSAKGVQMSTAMGKGATGLKGGLTKTAADKTAEETKKAQEESSTGSSVEEKMEKIKKKIMELTKKLRELQSSDKSEDLKKAEMQQIQSQIDSYQIQLKELMKEKSKMQSVGEKGGTRAEGFGSSLT